MLPSSAKIKSLFKFLIRRANQPERSMRVDGSNRRQARKQPGRVIKTDLVAILSSFKTAIKKKPARNHQPTPMATFTYRLEKFGKS